MIAKWKQVNPPPGEKAVRRSTEKQVRLTRYLKMPETTDDSNTLTIEQAQEKAAEVARYGDPSLETLEKLEGLDGGERYDWWKAAEDIDSASLAFKAMRLDSNIPKSVVDAVRDPQEWEVADPQNIGEVTCSMTGTDLFEVEVENPEYNEDGNVTYVDSRGHEFGGFFVEERPVEFSDVSEDSDGFISERAVSDLELHSSSSTSIAAFLPEEGDKIHVESQGTVRRDMSEAEGIEELTPASEYPEVLSVIDAIIRGDSDEEVLEDWRPCAARNDESSSRGMEQKVQEIVESGADEYYLETPLIAVVVNDGPASGKHYVAVPTEEADRIDDLLFNPDHY